MNLKLNKLTILLAAASTALPSLATASDDLEFYGYARYGFHYEYDGNDYVKASGQFSNSVGRLGNESNGGEFGVKKYYNGYADTLWEFGIMAENYWQDPDVTSDIALKRIYAGVSNVFDSQPELYIWAGRNFNQRPQEQLNDYYFMLHDGQGAGFQNLHIGGVKLDAAFVGDFDGSNNTGVDDNGDYAFTSRLHNIKLGNDLKLELLANYGFSDKQSLASANEDAYQVGSILNFHGHQFSVRYAENADNTVFRSEEFETKEEWAHGFIREDDFTTFYMSLLGQLPITNRSTVDYLLSYHSYDDQVDDTNDRVNYSMILRPKYHWTPVHSTWLEAGYSLVDHSEGSEQNTAWKLTLSQNIAIGQSPWAPMLRFYATVGQADTEKVYLNSTLGQVDTFAVGAMFESFWN